MVRSCGWGHPRPRFLQSYRGLGQSPSGNYSPHTLRTIGQGDGTVSHPILSVLTLHPGDLTDYGRQLALAAAMAIQ